MHYAPAGLGRRIVEGALGVVLMVVGAIVTWLLAQSLLDAHWHPGMLLGAIGPLFLGVGGVAVMHATTCLLPDFLAREEHADDTYELPPAV